MNQTMHDHYDPCRLCKGVYARGEMLRAERVLGKASRGWVCRDCQSRRARLNISSIITKENKRRGLA